MKDKIKDGIEKVDKLLEEPMEKVDSWIKRNGKLMALLVVTHFMAVIFGALLSHLAL